MNGFAEVASSGLDDLVNSSLQALQMIRGEGTLLWRKEEAGFEPRLCLSLVLDLIRIGQPVGLLPRGDKVSVD